MSGLLMFIAYGLILFALQFSRVSYITPAPGVGTVIGLFFGTLMLGEPFGKGRALGSCLIVFGLVLIRLAPQCSIKIFNQSLCRASRLKV
ncbi:MAG TPA: EamA family transporter [Dehalococcoidia bacterium]|jgi:drug/metabolite transporter (DMT)-like permease|nr:EamA family transporter [Dehalococcoidia bacterium]